jgi:hypothetical protein
LSSIVVPGWAFSKLALREVRTPVSDDAADTVMLPDNVDDELLAGAVDDDGFASELLHPTLANTSENERIVARADRRWRCMVLRRSMGDRSDCRSEPTASSRSSPLRKR